MSTKLYVIPGSHPSMSARLMLEHKEIPYKRVDLIPALHKAAVRGLGFKASTVPAIKIDGKKIQGTQVIAEYLDKFKPRPPLFPLDTKLRSEVKEVEQWGDISLQPIPRKLIWWAFKRDSSAMETFAPGARLGLPIGLLMKTSAPVIAIAARYNKANDANVEDALERLPGYFDRIDSWIEQGLLNGDQLNAADFQIGPSLRLLHCFKDLSPYIEGRPIGELALRVAPNYPGKVGPVLPKEWLKF